MNQMARYVPALGFDVLTPLYDPLVALTTRERPARRILRGGGLPRRHDLPPNPYAARQHLASPRGEAVSRASVWRIALACALVAPAAAAGKKGQ
jgi:hypothetical protein